MDSSSLFHQSTDLFNKGLVNEARSLLERALININASSSSNVIEITPSLINMWIRKCDAELLLQASLNVINKTAPNQTGSVWSGYRFDWVQTRVHVDVTVFAKNISYAAIQIEFESNSFKICLPRPANAVDSEIPWVFSCQLQHSIVADQCSYTVSPYKVEIKLLKTIEGQHWESLERKDSILVINQPSYPSSSMRKHDWSKVEKDIKCEIANEKPEGDAALDALFKDIYSKADEDTRRAMIKSYQTSGGTVLSTNWKEVKEKDYEKDIQPPQGMESRKF